MSPTLCPFQWDFPTLDFKILNNDTSTLFLTEIVLDVEASRSDYRPLFAIKRDVHQSNAGNFVLVNEGYCDLVDMTISFNLIPGEISQHLDFSAPYKHSIDLPVLADQVAINVTSAFQSEGVDIDELILLENWQWESKDIYIVPTADGSEERLTIAEMNKREKQFLGRFQGHVGTLIGEISFTTPQDRGLRQNVKFHAVVYLANENRRGIPRPPSWTYETVLTVQKSAYQRRVQLSQELQPGEADRFLIKIAVTESSSYRFYATIRDIAGREFRSLPLELNCFVPRSLKKAVEAGLRGKQ